MAIITIKDIAKQLNLSISTVSKALRNYPDISPETKEKVLAMASALNYQPNVVAQNLRRKSTRSIGVVVPDICYPYFYHAISGISKVIYENGYTLMLSQSNEEKKREILNTRALMSNRVAGFLVSISKTSDNVDHLKVIQQKRIPIVLFDRTHDEIKTSKVISDDYDGAFKAVEYLIKSGRKQIAHITGPIKLGISQARLNGYLDALRKHKLPINKQLIFNGNFQVQQGTEGMRWFLEQGIKPDAVFAANDEEAYGVYETCKEVGLKIPEDVAVIGFSNDEISAVMEPPLTTVEQPAFEIGEAAANLLLEEIISHSNGRVSSPQTKIFKTRLIIRASTD